MFERDQLDAFLEVRGVNAFLSSQSFVLEEGALPYIEFAERVLCADVDSPHIRILAGLDPRVGHFELLDTLNRVFKDLGIRPLEKGSASCAYVAYYIINWSSQDLWGCVDELWSIHWPGAPRVLKGFARLGPRLMAAGEPGEYFRDLNHAYTAARAWVDALRSSYRTTVIEDDQGYSLECEFDPVPIPWLDHVDGPQD